MERNKRAVLHHREEKGHKFGSELGRSLETLSDLEGGSSSKCTSRQNQKAYERPLHEDFHQDTVTLRNVHVGILSLKNSMNLIVNHLGHWIAKSLTAEFRRERRVVSTARDFWRVARRS